MTYELLIFHLAKLRKIHERVKFGDKKFI